MLNIELLFLPPYSPNLNLIERVWKFLRSKCLNSKYYATFAEFMKGIEDCIEKFQETFQEELNSLLTWNFQTLVEEFVRSCWHEEPVAMATGVLSHHMAKQSDTRLQALDSIRAA